MSGVVWFLVLVLVGAAMFKMEGDLSTVDALYLTVVSASTVGYGEQVFEIGSSVMVYENDAASVFFNALFCAQNTTG